ncbi:unnamed protein product [Boreogadus saida]
MWGIIQNEQDAINRVGVQHSVIRAVGGPGTPSQRHPPVTLITEGISNRLLAGVRSAAAIVEASIALQLISSKEDLISINEAHTPQNQRRALFHAMERGTSEAKEAFYQTLALKEPELVLLESYDEEKDIITRKGNAKASATRRTKAWQRIADRRHVSVIVDGESPEIHLDSSGLHHCPFCRYKKESKCAIDYHIKGHASFKYREAPPVTPVAPPERHVAPPAVAPPVAPPVTPEAPPVTPVAPPERHVAPPAVAPPFTPVAPPVAPPFTPVAPPVAPPVRQRLSPRGHWNGRLGADGSIKTAHIP